MLKYWTHIFISSCLIIILFSCGGGSNSGNSNTDGTGTINATLSSISVTALSSTVPISFNQSFTATGTYSDGTSQDISSTVIWSSSNTTIATVASSGIATGLTIGTVTITATSGDKTGVATLTVIDVTLSSVSVSPLTASIPNGLTQTFIATGTFSDGTSLDISSTAIWSSNNLAIATINSSGVATSVAIGTTTITATYNEISGSATINVTVATLTSIAVTPLTPSISSGLTQAFIATGFYSDGTSLDISSTVTWASEKHSIATIATTGIATGISPGTTTITATASGKSGMTALTVTATTLNSIAVTPLTASVPSGRTQAFIATGTYSDGTSLNITNNVTWSSNNTLTATILATGVATGLSIGTATITATSGVISGTATITITTAVLSSISVTPINSSVLVGNNSGFCGLRYILGWYHCRYQQFSYLDF